MKMKRLRLRQHTPIRTSKGQRLLGSVRKQLVPATPEEQVRQSVLECLVNDYGYPPATLLSEEPIARGTRDRRRADVLVRLPRATVRASLRTEVETTSRRRERPYSKKLADIADNIAGVPGLEAVVVPDHVDLDVDGENLSCRVLGFAAVDNGHALALAPPEDRARSLSLPPTLAVLVNGYTCTPKEADVASVLGIPHVEWTYDGNLGLIDAFAPMPETSAHVRLWIEHTVRSRDGWTGALIMSASDEDAFGVLTWFDADIAHEELDLLDEDDAADASPTSSPALSDGESITAGRNDHAYLIVVECKAPSVALTEEVTAQGLGYLEKLDAAFLVTTNGVESRCFKRTASRPDLVPIDDIPTYQALLDDDAQPVRALPPPVADPPLPKDLHRRRDCLRFHTRYRSFIGVSADEELWAPLLALHHAILDRRPILAARRSVRDITFIEDLGLNEHAPGSPAGGSWPGVYRDLLVETPDRRRVVLGVSMLGCAQESDKRYLQGYRRKVCWTYLIVALSDDAEYESVLQLPFDRDLKRDVDEWRITHNGALTAGKGAVKRQMLFDALAERAPHLVGKRCVELGVLPAHGHPLAEADLWDTLARLAEYVFIRRDVKNSVKGERRAKKRRRKKATPTQLN